MKNLRILVLMTAYNCDRYIAEAIERVLQSTYKNWELIIVGDASSPRRISYG